MRRWFWGVLIGIDQFANALLGPALNVVLRPGPGAHFGDPDETLSSVFGKNVELGACRACRWLCRVLHRLDPDHCARSLESDEGGRAL